MALMVALCVAVLLGIVAVWRWGALDVEPRWDTDDPEPVPAREVARRYVWYATIGITSGLVAGVVMLGAGGRLAMRLLAMTAGDAAQGRITEADQIVGKITLGGTLGFMAFIGIVGGTLLGILYMMVRRWLPRGRWGGVVYGCLLLFALGPRADPLRPDNIDFDLVGPGWVSVLVFSAVVVGYGMLVSAIAGRYAAALPLPSRELKVVAAYLPAYVVWGPSAFVLAIPLAIGCGVAILLARTEGVRELASNPRTMLVGRALGVLVLLVTLPTFAQAAIDIATR